MSLDTVDLNGIELMSTFGARTGVLMISMRSLAKIASKSRLNLLSRSRIRKRSGVERSAIVHANWRACWATQAPVGLAVQPATWTRRLPSSMKKGAVQPLQRDGLDGEEVDREHARRLRPQKRTPGEAGTLAEPGPSPAWCSSLRTVVAETSIPSPRSSPTMR